MYTKFGRGRRLNGNWFRRSLKNCSPLSARRGGRFYISKTSACGWIAWPRFSPVRWRIVTATDIDKFLLDMDAAPRTRNNFRLVVGTLLRFGQVRGYVAKDHPCISTIEKASHTDGEVG